MIMITLKMCSLHKGSFDGDLLVSSCVFIRKNYPNRQAGSVSGIIYFYVYISLFHLARLDTRSRRSDKKFLKNHSLLI